MRHDPALAGVANPVPDLSGVGAGDAMVALVERQRDARADAQLDDAARRQRVELRHGGVARPPGEGAATRLSPYRATAMHSISYRSAGDRHPVMVVRAG